MASYAQDTKVPVSRSRDELYRVLSRYGATETLLYESPERLRVGFAYAGWKVAIPFDLPRPADFPSQAAFDRELRRRWRVLILLVKGKLEMVEEGAEDITTAFLPYILLPGGGTVADEVVARVAEAQRTGQPPDLLPGLPKPATVIALGDGRRAG